MALTLRSGSATDRGRVRPNNQDCILDQDGLYAVADGMGGHAGGEVAARTAIDTIRSQYGSEGETPPSLLARSVQAANQAVWNEAGANRNLRGMGTTLVGLAVAREQAIEKLVVANVGDSRAYVLKNGNLVQITTDHTIVEAKLASGELTPEEAAHHPHRHILTRALGTEPNVAVDAWQMQPVVGDRYLLCSDGLFNEVNEAEIAALLGKTGDPGAVARQLVDLARAHGGSDNISVVVVDVLEAHGGPAAAGESAPRAADSAAAGLAGGAFGAAMMGIAGGTARPPTVHPPGPTGPSRPGDARQDGSPEAGPEREAKQPTAAESETGQPDPEEATVAITETRHPAPAVDPAGADTGPGRSEVLEEPGDATTGAPAEEVPPSRGRARARRTGPKGRPMSAARPEAALPDLAAGESPGGMSDVLADVLRAADSPDWQSLTTAVPRSVTGPGRRTRLGGDNDPPPKLDHLFAASERALALREAEEREALRGTIRHNEARTRGPRFASARRHEPEEPGTPADPGGDTPGQPLVTWRVVGFAVLLIVVVVGSVGSVIWFAHSSFYVGVDGQNLAVYHGRPNGLAWFQPHLVEKTGVTTADVLPSRVNDLRSGVVESSVGAALAYVRNLTAEKSFAAAGGAVAPPGPAATPVGTAPTSTSTQTSTVNPSGTVPSTTAVTSPSNRPTTAPAGGGTSGGTSGSTTPPAPASTVSPPPTPHAAA